MKRILSLLIILSTFFSSCNDEPSLQKYFVEKTENKNFIALDLSPSMLNVDSSKLSSEENEALKSFEKVNILAFKLDKSNKSEFETEKVKVGEILKEEKYQQLMKFGSGKNGASVSFIGDTEHIDEFVFYANNKENGFAIVRVLGKDMNPTGIFTLMSVLKNANVNLEQLKPLQQLIAK
jgi:ribonuclease BN (tRNA processing enzyme)